MKPLTVKETALVLRISPASVYNLCAAKRLRHQRVGVGRGRILISVESLEEYVAQATVETAGASSMAPAKRSRIKTFEHLDPDRLLEAWRRQGVV